jgi:hypothetical protein
MPGFHFGPGRWNTTWRTGRGAGLDMESPEIKLIWNYDFLHATHGSTFQPYLDPMWMGWGPGKDLFHNPSGQFAGTLILFEYDLNSHTRLDVGTGLSIHMLYYL